MEAPPLVLNAKCENFNMDFRKRGTYGAKEDKVYEEILKRDENKCQYCQFKPSVRQEIHHLNHDHSDNSLENLVTVCTFCHMVHHIGNLGKFLNPSIVWLPGISQTNLNHLVRTCLVAQCFIYMDIGRAQHKNVLEPKDLMIGTMNLFVLEFELCKNKAIERIGTCSPQLLGEALLKLSTEEDRHRESLLQGLRLLPDGMQKGEPSNEVKDIVKSWQIDNGPYANITPDSWARLAENCSFD